MAATAVSLAGLPFSLQTKDCAMVKIRTGQLSEFIEYDEMGDSKVK